MQEQIQKHQVYNLIILDESGSMSTIKEPTIRGFNEIVETTREIEKKFPEQQHFVSLVSFNTSATTFHLWNDPVSNLQKMNDEVYNPNAGTPLYDAIGQSVSKLKECLPVKTSYNVLVTILTDGEENSSVKYSAKQIKDMIEKLEAEPWVFTYIGANHDIWQAADNLAIKNTMRFSADKEGVFAMLFKEKMARMNYARELRRAHYMVKPEMKKGFYNNIKQEPEQKS